MSSKYPGVSHSPRKASRRRTVLSMVGFPGEPGRESISGGVGKSEKGCDVMFEEEDGISTLTGGRGREFVAGREEEEEPLSVDSGMEASPALMPMDVCTHRKNGEEWTTI